MRRGGTPPIAAALEYRLVHQPTPAPKLQDITFMPKEPRSARRKAWEASPEQKKRRAARNTARAKLMKAGKVRKGDGKDVDHKDRNPRNNAAGNLRVQTKSQNRSRNSLLGRHKSILG